MRGRGNALLLFFAAAALRLAAGPAGSAPLPDYAQFGTPDQAAGRADLERFRQAGLPPGYFEFQLRLLPRRGDERDYPGRLWVARNARGPVLRIVLNPGAPDERRWLIQGGARPGTWRFDPRTGAAVETDPTQPLLEGAEVTPFDLQMPFLYWTDETLEGVSRRGVRPANVYLFRPPADFAAGHAGLWGVRAYFDTEYDAPVEIDVLGPGGSPLRTLSTVDLKKIDGQAIVRQLDVRDERTRDKTRFDVGAAALNLDLPASFFEPQQLGGSIVPPAGRIERFGG